MCLAIRFVFPALATLAYFLHTLCSLVSHPYIVKGSKGHPMVLVLTHRPPASRRYVSAESTSHPVGHSRLDPCWIIKWVLEGAFPDCDLLHRMGIPDYQHTSSKMK